MEQDPNEPAADLSGGRIKATVAAFVGGLASSQSENLTRAAEVSCCGGICPTCAPFVAANLVLPGVAKRIRRNRAPADQSEADIDAPEA